MEHLGPPDRPVAPLPELVWLRKIIVERALTRGDYVLSGGVRSDYYIDKFRLFSDPNVLRRIARLFTPLIAEVNPNLIAGTELGGVVIATAVSQLCGLPMIAVRKKPKGYGAFADEYVEGPFQPGQHALLLEDVVTNGRELMAATARLEEAGLKVTPCAVISRGLAPIRALIQFSLPRTHPKTQN
jgi:orotate phosphoribosyltransferase